MASFQPGSSIERYQLIRLLGEGGMGEVWQALDTLADRPVALKFIRPERLDDPANRARFIHEAKTLARLEQDRIVPLYTVLDQGDKLAFVLRYIEGQSLAGRIESQFPLPRPFILSACRDVLSALGYAHGQGVIHRDVKPHNILVNRREQCFLTDFGIAIAGFLERVTVVASAIGTPHYMSPEQIARPREVTIENRGHRSDIYSFGVVLFQMLTGQVPFGQNSRADEVFSVQQAHLQTPPPSLTTLNQAVSPALEAVVLHCLEKDPDRRPQSCAELLAEIEAAAGSLSPDRNSLMATYIEAPGAPALASQFATRIEVPTRIEVLPARQDAPPRRPRRMLAAAVAAAVVAAASTVGLGLARGWFSSGSHPSSTATLKPPSPAPLISASEPPAQPPAQPVAIQAARSVPAPHVPGNIVSRPLPPGLNHPAPQNDSAAGAQKQAADLASQAAHHYQDGDYCMALASLNEAINLSNDPAYVKLRPGYVNACNHEQTN